MGTEAKKNKIDGFAKNNKKKGDGPLKIFKILQILEIFGTNVKCGFLESIWLENNNWTMAEGVCKNEN